MKVTWNVFGVLFWTTLVHGSQILGIFSHPGKSHFDFFRPLLLGLATAGHNVTVLSYFPNKKPVANYSDLQLSGMPVIASNVDLKAFADSQELVPSKVSTFFMLHAWGMQACEAAFGHVAVKRLVRSPPSRYDVVILEQFNNDCMMAVAHLLQAPVVALSSCALMPWHFQRLGSPFLPSLMPMNFLPHTDEMTFLERLNNFIHFHAVKLLYEFHTQGETNALIRQHFGESVPPVQDLIKRTSVMLINQYYPLTGATPYAPTVVEVGGLQIGVEEPLPPSLKALLDNASEGVVYISWGSMIRPETLPEDKRASILQAIARFPAQLFLMKWPNDTLANAPDNLRTRSWLPQRDLLCHPHVRAFMTHGGLLGVSEAAYCGVPMLVTPVYGDQFLNSARIQQRKLGVVVKYQDLTESRIVAALRTVMEPDFAQPAKQLAAVYRNRPQKPLDLAIWWVEHVIQTKGAPLAKSASINLSWFLLNSLDVILFLVFCSLLTVWLLHRATKTCLMVLFKREKSAKSRKFKSQ